MAEATLREVRMLSDMPEWLVAVTQPERPQGSVTAKHPRIRLRHDFTGKRSHATATPRGRLLQRNLRAHDRRGERRTPGGPLARRCTPRPFHGHRGSPRASPPSEPVRNGSAGNERKTRKERTMIARWSLPVTVLMASAFGVAVPTLAALPDDVRPGTRVEVKGRLVGPRALLAELVEIDMRPGGDDGLGGVIESVDAPAKALTAVGIRIATSDETVLEGESRQPLVFGDFKRGQWISVDGTLGEDGSLRASEVRSKTAKPEGMRQTKLEGRVQRVDAARNAFVLLGATVTVTPQTQIAKVIAVERRRQGQVMRAAFRPSAAAAGLTGKAPRDQKTALAALTEAEKEVTRRFRDNVVPRLWQTAAAAPLGERPLGERMYEYVAQNPLGEAREHTALSQEDLVRIKRILTRIRGSRQQEPREAPSGQLALTLEDAV